MAKAAAASPFAPASSSDNSLSKTQVFTKCVLSNLMILDEESGPALKLLPVPQHDSSSSAPNKTNAWIGRFVTFASSTASSIGTHSILANL